MKRLIMIVIVVSMSACAGIEAGGKFGLYAVDDRREVQETRSKARPLVCLWKKCDEYGNIQGS